MTTNMTHNFSVCDDYIRCCTSCMCVRFDFDSREKLVAANFYKKKKNSFVFSSIRLHFLLPIFDWYLFFFSFLFQNNFSLGVVLWLLVQRSRVCTEKVFELVVFFTFFIYFFFFAVSICVRYSHRISWIHVTRHVHSIRCNKINFTCLLMLKSWNIINTTLNIKFEGKTRLKKKIGSEQQIFLVPNLVMCHCFIYLAQQNQALMRCRGAVQTKKVYLSCDFLYTYTYTHISNREYSREEKKKKEQFTVWRHWLILTSFEVNVYSVAQTHTHILSGILTESQHLCNDEIDLKLFPFTLGSDFV